MDDLRVGVVAVAGLHDPAGLRMAGGFAGHVAADPVAVFVAVRARRARIARIAEAVAVEIDLVRVRHAGAVVDAGEHSVGIAVLVVSHIDQRLALAPEPRRIAHDERDAVDPDR